MTRLLLRFLPLLSLLALACNRQESPSPDPSVSPLSQGGTGAGGLGGTTRPTECPTDAPGPTMVRLSTPSGAPYCMDRTEVTQSQYVQFMAYAEKHPEVLDFFEGQHSLCQKYPFDLVKRTPGPEDDVYTPCRASLFNPEKYPDNAVVCTSHCAARLYCRWAGKELCGKVEGGPGVWDPQGFPSLGEFENPEKGAWYNACTNGGKTDSPVKDGLESGKCVSVGPQNKTFPTVESQPECHGDVSPFDQVLGLWGGVREWQDFCDGNGCLVGGAIRKDAPDSFEETCKNNVSSDGGPSESVGFRCCLPLATP